MGPRGIPPGSPRTPRGAPVALLLKLLQSSLCVFEMQTIMTPWITAQSQVLLEPLLQIGYGKYVIAAFSGLTLTSFKSDLGKKISVMTAQPPSKNISIEVRSRAIQTLFDVAAHGAVRLMEVLA